jgi:phosphoribosylamine--glycine ligase
MHILLVSKDGDGAWFVWLLIHEGHKVEWTCANPKYQDSLKGLVPPPLTKVSDPAAYDLIIYDDSGFGDSADAARAHSPVIGGSAYADRLEDDRVFGIQQMEAAGIKVPKWEAFSSPAEALSFLAKNNRRYVLKPIGDAPSDATYVSKSRDDMTHFIETKLDAKVKSFVLQEFVAGTEVSTEAWWTGREFVAMNHTLELKKFMNDDMGPNTGCAGNVVWMPTRPNAIYEQGLKKLASELGGFPPQMFDLNTIVTEADIYGLEWTPRFGYEGTCNLTRLLNGGFGEFLFAVATGTSPVVEPRARFAATIRLSVPPYPNAELARKRVQVPIVGVEVERLDSFVLYDVMKDEDEVIITGGYNNGIGGPIGCGETIDGAFQECDEAIHRLDIPNLQYRTDASKSLQARYSTLQAQGWLRPIG